MTRHVEQTGSKINDAAKSGKSGINEEREFQLRLLEIQRSYDTLNAFLTTVQAVSYSFVVSILTVAFTVKTTALVQTVFAIATIIFSIVGGVSTFVLIRFHKKIIKKQINQLRKEFVYQN